MAVTRILGIAPYEGMRSLMVQQLGYEPTAAHQIGAAVAANAGPRVVGAAFTRKKEGYSLMKAAQITQYSKRICLAVHDIADSIKVR